MTFAERLADRFAAVIGSWRFILIQTTLLICWIIYNVTGGHIFDEYPFILLNLLLSIQAAFTGPILLLSANRQATIDRRRAMKNLIIDQQDHAIIIRLEQHLDNHFHELLRKLKTCPCLDCASKSGSQQPHEHQRSSEGTQALPLQDQTRT